MMFEFHCIRCEVTWKGESNVCWSCGKSDQIDVQMQCGLPVRYYPEPEGATQ